jgi:hypothetical protein
MGGDMKKLKEWYKPGTKRAEMAQLDKYMGAVKEFRMQLLILMHITGGQPATVASTRVRFRTVSCMWHLWLGFSFVYDHTAFKLYSLWHVGYLRDNFCDL